MSETLTLITPKCIIKFPSTKIGETEYSVIKSYKPKEGEDVVWKFVGSFDPSTPQAQELLKVLTEESSKIKSANFKPFKKDKSRNEQDEIVENGNVAINFTSGYPIKMVDSQLKECNVDIGWGAECVVKFNAKPVNKLGKVGLGRYPLMIQVLSLGGSANTEGLVAQEGYKEASEVKTDVNWTE